MSRLWVVLVFLVAADAAFAQQRTLGAVATDNAATFRGQVGRRVTYVCPAYFPLAGSVYGTDVYTDDSPICLAAAHAGVLQAGTAGAVTFVIGGDVASFQGSTRNGVKSQGYTSVYPTMQFDTGGAPGQIDWATTGARIPQEFTGTVVVTCPPRGITSNTLWGTDVYADDSQICVAAVHAGVITLAAGGPVAVTPAPGAASYTQSTRNGITSQRYGAWTASFRVAAPSGASAAPAGNTVTSIGVGVTALGLATVSWAAPPGAQSYVVARWNSDDATCCNNLSPPAGPLTATQWVDTMLLQKYGPYTYRVYAHTSTGVLTGETSINWNGTVIEAPTFTRPPGTGTRLTERAPDSSTTPTLASTPSTGTRLTERAPTSSTTPTPVATLPANAGRYRVTLTGVQVTATTKDVFDNTDGQGDEIAAVAIAAYFERGIATPQAGRIGTGPILRDLRAVRGVEYGDINALRKDADRLRAGNAADGGGLVVQDVVPEGFTPGNSRGTPSAREFPLLVWEGILHEGTDAVLIVPSLWERDIARARLDAYVNGWLTGSIVDTLKAADVQVPLPGVIIVQTTINPAPPTAYAVADLAGHVLDRPLGLTLQPLVVEYHDRFIVLTREKLADLAAGSYRSLAIQYVEPAADPVLGEDYTLEMRIERLE
jgi:hypothetical protein